jgi:8-oxo-dGTP pyrophosphatase MutT (NUDIX family)
MNLNEYKAAWRKPLRKVTICFLVKDDKVLLAMKKRRFGTGKWNGTGGKLKEGESIEEGAIRETKEEIGVDIKKMKEMGVIRFYFSDMSKADDFNQEGYVFTVTEWDGVPSESEEMAPRWFNVNELPFESMWSDDPHWLPKVLEGKFVDAEFLFDDKEKPIDVKIEERIPK